MVSSTSVAYPVPIFIAKYEWHERDMDELAKSRLQGHVLEIQIFSLINEYYKSTEKSARRWCLRPFSAALAKLEPINANTTRFRLTLSFKRSFLPSNIFLFVKRRLFYAPSLSKLSRVSSPSSSSS
jgi:hypothetical protein